jgi:DNA polymerase-1
MEKKLYLLDAYALIFRSYYAFIKNPRINSQGLNTSAIFGFTNTMLDLIRRENPTHIGVVFDLGAPTVRTEEHSFYKANREETPEDIRKSVPYIVEIIKGFNIPILGLEGFEADDVIGTLAKKAEKAGFTTYMMTPDKDFGQLVSENIFMYKPARGGNAPEIWGVKEVCEKFEVERPEQVIDILGLWGDAVDNIPGIPGIGEKTSKKLIAQYGSVEGLIEHADELKGKQKENVINFAEQGLVSKKLATIILDVPVDFEPDKLVIDEPNKDRLMELFSELEFRTLAKRVFGEEAQIQTQAAPAAAQMDLFAEASQAQKEEETELISLSNYDETKSDYKWIKSEKEFTELCARISEKGYMCFDTETTALNPFQAELVGMSISLEKGEAFYVHFSDDERECEETLSHFKTVLEDVNIRKIGQNLKYDVAVLKNYGVEVNGVLEDTMLIHYLLNPDMRHNMDYLAETYLNYTPISIETLIGKKGKKQGSMRDVEAEKIVPYACEDADITLQLFENFKDGLNQEHLKNLYYQMEAPLIKVLLDMEHEGIKLNADILKEQSKEIDTEILALSDKIKEVSGVDFNIDSPRQLGEVLFDHMKITAKAKKTKTGQYSTSEDVLEKYRDKHPIIGDILSYRQLRKLKSTYVDALPELIEPRTGRIHTSYLQTVAATGRLSSNNPNLQNIPIRTERGRQVRKAFEARDENYLLLAADYSQIELRIVASLAKDEFMIESFRQGKDIHASTAAKVFGVDQSDVSRDQRSKAKAVNFGLLYGQSAFGLSQNLSISRKEAKEIIDSYFAQFSSIKEYIAGMQDFARQHGYVETIMKRRRYLKDINSANAIVRGHAERNAINAPIQGSAADIIKLAMIDIHKEMSRLKMKSKMLLQVHDELVFDMHLSEKDALKDLVKSRMENAVKLEVPLTVEMDEAKNWLEAH